MPVVEEMMDTGLMAISDVRMVRVQKKAAAPDERAADRTEIAAHISPLPWRTRIFLRGPRFS